MLEFLAAWTVPSGWRGGGLGAEASYAGKPFYKPKFSGFSLSLRLRRSDSLALAASFLAGEQLAQSMAPACSFGVSPESGRSWVNWEAIRERMDLARVQEG